MDEGEVIESGRKYLAYISPDEQAGAYIIIGPPPGLVDVLGLPEEIATRLHNALYARRIFTYADISKKGVAMGVLQEVLSVDAQKLAEIFAAFEKEPVGG